MKKNLTIFFLFFSLIAQAQLESGLVAYWPLNGDGTDISGNGYQGTLNRVIIPTTDRGNGKQCAIQFEGSNSSIIVADITSPIPNFSEFFEKQVSGKQTFAYSLWFKSPVGLYKQGIFLKYLLNDIQELTWGFSNDTVYFSNPDGKIAAKFNDIGWNHVVYNWNYSGQEGTSITINGQTTSFSQFMNYYLSNITTIKGVLGSDGLFLDDFRVYDRTLSASEVTQLYQLPSSCSLTTDLSSEIISEKEKEIMKIVDISGQEISDFENFRGLALVVYSNGSHRKVLK